MPLLLKEDTFYKIYANIAVLHIDNTFYRMRNTRLSTTRVINFSHISEDIVTAAVNKQCVQAKSGCDFCADESIGLNFTIL